MANTQNLDLVKPLGTDHALVSVLNSNSDKIDAYAGAVNAGLDGLRDGLGILADGNTHAAITSGQFVYVKNHQTLPEGLYQASTNIAANGTLSTSNLTADPKGGLNTLSEQIVNLIKEQTSGSSTSQKVINAISNANNFIVLVGYGGEYDMTYALTLFVPKLSLSNEMRYFQVSDSYNTGAVTHLQARLSLYYASNIAIYNGATEAPNASFRVFYC